MVEIYRYVGKCIDGNYIIKFYEAIWCIFQINKLKDIEQHNQFQNVRRNCEWMRKLNRNKKDEQLNHAKPEIFGTTVLAERNADDEVDPLI